MKLNWGERWAVNNPLRVVEQRMELRKLRRMRPLAPGFTAIEIGCGRGAGAELILKTFQPRLLYATDLDLDMLRRAERYVAADRTGRISLVAADGYSLPFKPHSVDAVFGFGVLHHIPDWRSALCEVTRVLKAEGAFFFEELYPGVYQNFITRHFLAHPTEGRFRGREFREAFGDAGLSLYRYRELRGCGILGIALKKDGRKRDDCSP
jgi:ubiquinone/menaquinone biosynthesis C-methylase UbiE